VTFLKLGEINTLKEHFDADMLIRSKWREPRLDAYKTGDEVDWADYWNPKFFIENAIGEPKTTIAHFVEFNEEGDAFVLERKRCKGTYMEQLELWEFPFDVQDLSVTVMTDLPLAEIDLIEDPNEVHKIYKQGFIDEQEWYIYKYVRSLKREIAKDRADPSVRRQCLQVMCRAARRPAYFIWNIFSVTMLIAALSFVTFAVNPDLVQNRLQLTFTLVLTTVAFKFVINQSLPRISYLTYLDRYVLATLFVLFLITLWHGFQRTFLEMIPHEDHRNHPTLERADWIACVILMFAYGVFNLQFFIRILVFPYRKRREMKKLEQEYIRLVRDQASKRKHDGIKRVDSDSETEDQEKKLIDVKSKK